MPIETKHFDLHQLAEGVYAAIHKEGGAAYSNAGIVDIGERVLVFDAFDMLSAAKELRSAIEKLIGKPVTWLVNSHKHGDHWGGNQVFADDAIIISTPRTRKEMLAWGADLEKEKEKIKIDPSRIQNEILEMERKLQIEVDPMKRFSLERVLVRNRYMLNDLPEFEFRPPNQTFTGTVVFHGSNHKAELTACGPGHTPEECILYLPDEKIVFTGDLAFFDSPPFMAPDCNPTHWIEELESLRHSKNKFFVPGHGPVGTKRDLALEREYLQTICDLVAGRLMDGGSLNDVLALALPEKFSGWSKYAVRNENNLRTLYGQLKTA
jgi:cyclase